MTLLLQMSNMSYLNVKLKYAEQLKSKKEIYGNICGSQSYCIYEMLFIRRPVVNTEAGES